MEDGEGSCDRLLYWSLTRKFHSGLLRLCFEKRLWLGSKECVCLRLQKAKTQNVNIWNKEPLIDEKAPTEKMGHLVFPQTPLTKVQTSDFFNVREKGKGEGLFLQSSSLKQNSSNN